MQGDVTRLFFERGVDEEQSMVGTLSSGRSCTGTVAL